MDLIKYNLQGENFSEDELSELYKIFCLIDTDREGRLTNDQLTEFMELVENSSGVGIDLGDKNITLG